MRSEKGSDVVANMHCHPSTPAAHACLDARFNMDWNIDTVVACTNADGSAFQTFTKPKSDRWNWHNCVPLHRSTSCMSCLRRLARVPCPCVSLVGALGNSRSKSTCAVPWHILYRTPSMPMSRRSCRGARLNSRNACFSLISICLKNDDCTVSRRSSFEGAAWKIAP